MTNDLVAREVLRITCLISFSRPLSFQKVDDFCSHQLINYPLHIIIIIIKGIILFFPFLKSESLAFLF